MTTKNAAAQALGRLGGKANTDAQNAARARNAQRAGRPRRVCTTCGEPVVAGHVDRALDETCGAHGWRWQQRDQAPDGPLRVHLAFTREQLTEMLSLTGDAELRRVLRAGIAQLRGRR